MQSRRILKVRKTTQTFIVSAVRDVCGGWDLLLGTDSTGPWITALRDDGWTQPTVGDFVTVQLPVILAIVSETEWMERDRKEE